MSCQDARKAMARYEGTPDLASLPPEIAAHVARCPECADLLEAIARPSRVLPKEIAPPRDLWPGIEARLGRPLQRARSGGWLLAAAAVIALITITALFVIPRNGPGPRPGTVSGPVAERPARPATAVLRAADVLDASFRPTRDFLVRQIDKEQKAAGKEEPTPLRKDISVLDKTAALLRNELAQDPTNPKLIFMLSHTYRRQLDLLRQAVDPGRQL